MEHKQLRNLTIEEYKLSRWLLENGNKKAQEYLPQLEKAQATQWKCKCGCASFNFKVEGLPEAKPGVEVLSDYLFGNNNTMAGIFIFSSQGILSGLEVYGLAISSPHILPTIEQLRPFNK